MPFLSNSLHTTGVAVLSRSCSHLFCRYNGYEFETFGLKDGLTSNTVFKFYPQDNGDIWCSALNNRFFIFNPTDYVFRKYPYNDILARYAADAINDDLFIDSDGLQGHGH